MNAMKAMNGTTAINGHPASMSTMLTPGAPPPVASKSRGNMVFSVNMDNIPSPLHAPTKQNGLKKKRKKQKSKSSKKSKSSGSGTNGTASGHSKGSKGSKGSKTSNSASSKKVSKFSKMQFPVSAMSSIEVASPNR